MQTPASSQVTTSGSRTEGHQPKEGQNIKMNKLILYKLKKCTPSEPQTPTSMVNYSLEE
jgi:hypothetical protein